MMDMMERHPLATMTTGIPFIDSLRGNFTATISFKPSSFNSTCKRIAKD
jgi:hypothetical protein